MTVEQAVCERLLATGAVAALVGARVYQLKLPQSPTLPAVRVQLIDQPMPYHLRGGSVVLQSRVQTDVFAAETSGSDPYAAAVAVADAVDAALSGQPFTVVGMKITGSFRQTRMPLYESDELREVRIMQDYFVWSRDMT